MEITMKNWESILIGPEVELERAISVIDKGALQIALVVDENRRLLGTITDGDVRRALLKHLSLSVRADQVMFKTPRTAKHDWSRDKSLAVMEENGLLQLPIVDDEGRVIGLETLRGLLERKVLDNPVFLMAGGFGKRLHPLTLDCPKPLLKVGDKPILELIMESCIKAGFHRFYISTHYLPEMIREYFGNGERWGVNIKYVHEEAPLGTGGALGLLPHDEIDLPLLMMNGDLLTSLNLAGLLDFHNEHDGIATMCVREYEYQVPYGVITTHGHLVKSMVEKPIQKFFVNAGVYALAPSLVKSVKPGTCIDMPTLLEQAIEAGKEVTSFPVHEYWLDIGRMDDFERAQRELCNISQF